MKLSGSQKAALQKALNSAFRRSGDLKQMVTFGLDENLEAIAGTGALEDVIFELIEWADSRGRVEDLLTAAQNANSTNPDLAAFMATLDGANDQDEPPAAQGAVQPAETLTPPTTIIVTGDYIQGIKRIGGDDISVGDISNSQGIAIGRSSSASVVQGPADAARRISRGGQDPDVAELYQLLIQRFNLQELQDLCFDLGVDFEDLGGTGRKAKARELVQYMQRRGRLDALHQAILEQE